MSNGAQPGLHSLITVNCCEATSGLVGDTHGLSPNRLPSLNGSGEGLVPRQSLEHLSWKPSFVVVLFATQYRIVKHLPVSWCTILDAANGFTANDVRLNGALMSSHCDSSTCDVD